MKSFGLDRFGVCPLKGAKTNGVIGTLLGTGPQDKQTKVVNRGTSCFNGCSVNSPVPG